MNLSPSGWFSKMTRLSVEALRLYDEISAPRSGRPVVRIPVYHLRQGNRAEAVRILCSVDMLLDEIRAIPETDDPELVHKQ